MIAFPCRWMRAAIRRAVSLPVASFRGPQLQIVSGRQPRLSVRAAKYSTERAMNVFADFRVYKSRATLSARFVRAVVAPLRGDSSKLIVKREGGMMFEISPRRDGGDETRYYDYTKKRVLRLSANDCGEILAYKGGAPVLLYRSGAAFSATAAGDEGGAQEGAASASDLVLEIRRVQDKKSTFLSVYRKDAENDKITLPMSPGEFAALKAVLTSLIPDMLGFTPSMRAPSIDYTTPGGSQARDDVIDG